MDQALWAPILCELTFAVSGEQKLDRLLKKAATAFLKKLDCAHVSVFLLQEERLVSGYVIPRMSLQDPAYHQLVRECELRLADNSDNEIFLIERDLYYYGFPLPRFGLLLIGRSEPMAEAFLHELIPVADMLAQNCFSNLDATKERQAIEAKLQQERLLLRTIIDTIPDLIFYRDLDGNYAVVNEAFLEFFARGPQTVIGHSVWDIHTTAEADRCLETDLVVLKSGQVERYESDLKRHDGTLVPFEIIKAPSYDVAGKPIGMVAVCRSIEERKHYEQQLEYMGTHDQLTGLYDRRFLAKELWQLDTPSQLPISVVMGDLNGLKLVNDMFGHGAGDDLLLKAAESIRGSCRQDDLVIRWGGDEFVVLLLRTNEEKAAEIAGRIKLACNSQRSGHVPVSIALGWATKTEHAESIWQVLETASDRMYRDKLLCAGNYEQALVTFLHTALAAKSCETAEHRKRLQGLCHRLGQAMGLRPQQLNELELVVTLHDIGKVTIGESILLKPGPLSANEWQEMRKHPEIGYRFARAIPALSSTAEYIVAHHEHWDGNGYPRGLKGKEIPLLARIFAVVDAFEAMTNTRPYRQALPMADAVARLKAEAGSQFDPAVVDAFCQLGPADL